MSSSAICRLLILLGQVSAICRLLILLGQVALMAVTSWRIGSKLIVLRRSEWMLLGFVLMRLQQQQLQLIHQLRVLMRLQQQLQLIHQQLMLMQQQQQQQ